jgi:hypothetical protein
MLTPADLERERNESRRKAELDYNSGLSAARDQGRLIGRINVFEEMLNRPVTPMQQLLDLRWENLEQLASELLEEVKRGNS